MLLSDSELMLVSLVLVLKFIAVNVSKVMVTVRLAEEL